MKISFSLDLKPNSGKQIFACRLAKALKKQGIKVVDKKPDINIVIVKGVKPNCKNILRLDGIWMNNRDDRLRDKNKKIYNIINTCDGIIYQNQFCKDASDRLIGKCKNKYAIICNGANPEEFKVSCYQHDKPYFMALCKWRPHKRLKSIICGFLNSDLHTTMDLIVVGKPDYTIKHNSIKYFGNIEHSHLIKILCGSVATIHLAYIDWCPNSVVESILANRPVIHTSSGGTKLIVQNDGICINENKEWEYNIIDLYNPPNLDINEISQAYKSVLDVKVHERTDLHIDNIAMKYVSFFKEVL